MKNITLTIWALYLLTISHMIDANENESARIHYGNAVYQPLEIGETTTYLDKTITLVSIENNWCKVDVDGVTQNLIVALRELPVIVNGIRVFISDNVNVAELTKDRNEKVHGLVAEKGAVLCLSDPDKPLVDPDKFAFPVSRSDGWEWSNETNSHMFAYLGEDRSHEGIDFDIHDGRGKNVHAVLAVETGVIKHIRQGHGKFKKEAAVYFESLNHKGIYYYYSHINRNTLTVQVGDTIKKGQKLGYIWGDDFWGHLHLGVGAGWEENIGTYNLINVFPQMYELYYGTLNHPGKEWTKSNSWRYVNGEKQEIDHWNFYCNTFHYDSINYGNRVHREGFYSTVGYGWNLATWCTAYKMDTDHIYQDKNLRISKTLFAGTAAEAVNPNNYFDFEVSVKNGLYTVGAEVGDATLPSWQKVQFENESAGTFDLVEGKFTWIPEKKVIVNDGRLTIRFYLKDEKSVAGMRTLYFHKAE